MMGSMKILRVFCVYMDNVLWQTDRQTDGAGYIGPADGYGGSENRKVKQSYEQFPKLVFFIWGSPGQKLGCLQKKCSLKKNSEGILLGPDTFDEFFVCRIMTLHCDDALGQSTFGKNCWVTTLFLTRPKCPSAHHAGNLWPVPNLPIFRAQISGWKLENRVAYKKCVTLSFRMS